MASQASGVVKWPAYLGSVPLLILAFAPHWGLSPYLAVAITATMGGLGVYLSLSGKPTKLRWLLALVGTLVGGAVAGVIAALLSWRH